MRSYFFLLLLSLLLLSPAYVSFRRQMRKIKREVFGIGSVDSERRRDFIREDPDQNLKILGIPFVYVVIVIFLLWGVAVFNYVSEELME